MKLDFFTYRLPFKEPFVTSGHTFSHREGIVSVLEKEGMRALGEAAPLPGFSTESMDDVIEQIRNSGDAVRNLLRTSVTAGELYSFFSDNRIYPSLQCCLFTLFSSICAPKKGQSLHHFLFDDVPDTLPLNAVIDLGCKNPLQELGTYIEEGFETVKIKAGKETAALAALLKIIRKRYPDIKIRIDANQSWSLEQALHIFDEIAPLYPEYCEEPLADPTPNAFMKLKNSAGIPIALDESLVSTFGLREASEIADVLIIKPMVQGISTITESLDYINPGNPPKKVFTTSLESSIGRLMTATLAAGYGSEDTAHGLSTGRLLSTDIWNDKKFIKNGYFKLPNAQDLAELMKSGLSSLSLKKLDI